MLFRSVRGEDLPFNMMVNALGENIRSIDYVGYHYVQHSASAMNHFSGLGKFKLPVKEISEVMEYVKTNVCKNSYDYLELCVIRTFTVFLFQFGRKSSREKLYNLCDEIISCLNKQCPKCHRNPLLKVTRLKGFPVSQRLAVRLFTWLYQFKILKQISYILTRV